MKNPDPYLQQIHNTLPRILALYDTDTISPTYGMGDRYRWSWKLIDFGNATFQGTANGLSRLFVNGLLPEGINESAILGRIDAMFTGAQKLTYPNGSLEEAIPYESSFCVTALVAYDLLSAVELLVKHIDDETRNRYLGIVRPMIKFLHRADETHAFISNHLATASAALFKWSALTGEEAKERGHELLKRILDAQSEEGWFREYEGADPGYQTLCTYYLSDVHRMRPDLMLGEPLRRSIEFLWHFAHPDGSFGGLYGSRNTRFYYPAGIEALSNEIPEAASLAVFMRDSISHHRVVTLDVMDEPNLVPMFNAYCQAAALYDGGGQALDDLPVLPSASSDEWRRQFQQAGLLIDKGKNYYTVISWHKGGVCYNFSGGKHHVDAGVAVRSSNGKYYSTQAYQSDNDIQINDDTVTITASLAGMNKKLPTPLQFIILRLLNVTVMRNLAIGNRIKKTLVRLLITGVKPAPVKNRRTIHLGDKVVIEDALQGDTPGFSRLHTDKPFSAIHMASQGYWQRQDDAE